MSGDTPLVDLARTNNIVLTDFDQVFASDGSTGFSGSGWAVVNGEGKVSSGTLSTGDTRFTSTVCEFVAFQKALLKTYQANSRNTVILTDVLTHSFLTTWSREKVATYARKTIVPAIRKGAKVMPDTAFMELWDDLHGAFMVYHIKAHKSYRDGDLSDPAYLNRLADKAARQAANGT